MPRRTYGGRRFGGRGKRSATYWVDLNNDDLLVVRGADAHVTTTLYAPSEESDKVTVVRIVGSVTAEHGAVNTLTSLQAFWGIYRSALSGAAGSLTLDAKDAADQSSDDWLWWSVLMVPGASLSAGVGQQMVDIKAKRKLDLEHRLVMSFRCAGAVDTAFNLRGLFMQSAS